MTSARARRLINRLMKRYENQLPALAHHLEQRYGESPLPSKLPRRKEQADLCKFTTNHPVACVFYAYSERLLCGCSLADCPLPDLPQS